MKMDHVTHQHWQKT